VEVGRWGVGRHGGGFQDELLSCRMGAGHAKQVMLPTPTMFFSFVSVTRRAKGKFVWQACVKFPAWHVSPTTFDRPGARLA
jgi:hypothetical protein